MARRRSTGRSPPADPGLASVLVLFYRRDVQEAFDFVATDIAGWHDRLRAATPIVLPAKRRTPIAQLVKSLISGRTRDAVSLAAYRRLGVRYGSAARIAEAKPGDVASVIADVTFAETKAVHLVAALRRVERERGGFDLDGLGRWPLGEALAWLETLPGVAGKVAASTLNASTLDRPVMIVDSHVLRILARLGFISARADFGQASRAVTAAMHRWSGSEFLEFHIAMKRLGQTVCRFDAPLCAACPLADTCPSAGRSEGVR